MHFISAVIPLLALATALPTDGNLNKRQELPNESCSILSTDPHGGTPAGLHCHEPSRIEGDSKYIGNVNTTTLNECARECLRQPDCKSTAQGKTGGTCYLYGRSTTDLNIKPDPEGILHTDRDCYKLYGSCLPHEGDFESSGLYPQASWYNGTVNPWTQVEYFTNHASDFHLVSSGSNEALPVHPTLNGKQFLKTVVKDKVAAGMKQNVLLKPHQSYTVEISYNFAKFVQLFGKVKPTGYEVYVQLDNDVPIEITLPLTAAKNKWLKKSATFFVPEGGYSLMRVGVFALGPDSTSSYQATFGIDAISIKPAA